MSDQPTPPADHHPTAPDPRKDNGAQHRSSHAKDTAFDHTMQQAQSHMNKPQRLFSRFIHIKFIASISDIVGGTIARPNTILYGALSVLVLTAVFYTAAKVYGYNLSGAESVAAFFLGWLIGMTIDYTQVLLRGGRQRNKRS